MELEPIEDFRTVKHTTGLNEGLAKVDTLEIKMYLKKVNKAATKAGYHEGINRIRFKAPRDRRCSFAVSFWTLRRRSVRRTGLWARSLKTEVIYEHDV